MFHDLIIYEPREFKNIHFPTVKPPQQRVKWKCTAKLYIVLYRPKKRLDRRYFLYFPLITRDRIFVLHNKTPDKSTTSGLLPLLISFDILNLKGPVAEWRPLMVTIEKAKAAAATTKPVR